MPPCHGKGWFFCLENLPGKFALNCKNAIRKKIITSKFFPLSKWVIFLVVLCQKASKPRNWHWLTLPPIGALEHQTMNNLKKPTENQIPFKREICDKEFKSNNCLQKHFNVDHNLEVEHRCNISRRVFYKSINFACENCSWK